MKIALVGHRGGSHIGGSLERALREDGHDILFADAADAAQGNRVLRALFWRLRRQPLRLQRFSSDLLISLAAFKPDVLLTTGFAPITSAALQQIRKLGITTINYLTDDPWNPGFRADWIMESLAAYDLIFSPRLANLTDLQTLGGPRVEYLPFAYDPELFQPAPQVEVEYDVIFAGGADRDRVPMIRELVTAGLRVALFGHDWERFGLGGVSKGLIAPEQLPEAVAASAVALCIVRRANRDGHVMRTYELPAMRACILAEETAEQREILGDSVRYFKTATEMVSQVRSLLANPAERARLAEAAYQRITSGPNTYTDRARAMIAAAGKQ